MRQFESLLRVSVPLAALAALTAALLAPLWGRSDIGRSGPQRFRARPELVRAFAAVLCRPPSDRETVEWDGRPGDEVVITDALSASREAATIRDLRALYHERLGRNPGPADCLRLRSWFDRGTPVDKARRQLIDSPEGRRVAAVAAMFSDVLGRDPLGWDNASLRWWVDGPWTLAQIRRGLVALRPKVGLHYFMWYRLQDGAWRNDVTVVPADAPRPAAGPYSSADVDVMRRQLTQIGSLGVDFVIVHVVAQSPASWSNARQFFRLLEGHESLRAAVMLDGLHEAPAAVKAAWVRQVTAEFTQRTEYFSFHGRPLVMLFSAPLDFDVPDVLLRNVYWNERYEDGRNTFNSDLRLDSRDWAFWAPSPQPVVNGSVPVMPGYLDTGLDRSHIMEHARADGRLYHDQWRRALSLRPELIMVYSWNEYFERTAIEPTDRWGDVYMRWTECFVTHAHRGTIGDCP